MTRKVEKMHEAEIEEWEDDEEYELPERYNEEYFEARGDTKNEMKVLLTAGLILAAIALLWWMYQTYRKNQILEKNGAMLGYSPMFVPKHPQPWV